MKNPKASIILIVFIALLFLPVSQISFGDQQIVIWGRGFGHGVGLCQYGAYGQAKVGKAYDSILKYYLKDTYIKEYSDKSIPTVRVLITETTSVILAGTPEICVEDESKSPATKYVFYDKIKIEARSSGSSLSLALYKYENGRYQLVGIFVGPLRITLNSSYNDPTKYYLSYFENGKRYDYCGYFKVTAQTATKLYLVNFVDLEKYVWGIAEMPSSWPAEALKAQAVAARTYAYRRINSNGPFDLYDDQRSQVYVGLNKINGSFGTNWKQACEATKRKLLYYGDRIASVYYHSTCGGHTENSEDVWSGAYPELMGVECTYCSSSPRFTWETTVTLTDINKAFGSSDDPIVAVQILSRIKGRRVYKVILYKKSGQTITEEGYNFRSKLGLNSTWFYFRALRIAGKDRYQTNLYASQQTFTAARYAIIVSGKTYPDGISAASLAGVLDAPLLLTNDAFLSFTAKSELLNLKPEKVYLIGGEGAISFQVEEEIKNVLPSCEVVRLRGADRYKTNLKVLEELAQFKTSLSKIAFVVSGVDFPDAIAAAPMAFRAKAPIILSDGKTLTPEALARAKELGITRVIVVGGTGVIAQAVEETLRNSFGSTNVKRIGGLDRYETAYYLAKESLKDDFKMTTTAVAVASGLDFADAISASFFCGKKAFPLLLSRPDKGSYWAVKCINEYKPMGKYIFGGTGAISLEAEIQLFPY